jgi:hypothetical protein
MKLKEYAEIINKLAEEYPDVLVVYASDDEGNSFQKANHAGTVGFFDGNYHGDFIDLGSVEKNTDNQFEEYVGKKPNAICIN